MRGTRESYTPGPAVTITVGDVKKAGAGIRVSDEAVDVVLGASVTIRVALERTLVGFGGERLWLKCPACSRRASRLHQVGDRLLCVRCAGITPPGRRLHRDRQWEAWGRAAHRLAQVRVLLERRYLRLARRGQLERLAERLEREVCAGLLVARRAQPTFPGLASAEPTITSEDHAAQSSDFPRNRRSPSRRSG